MSNIMSIVFVLASIGMFVFYADPKYRADTGSRELSGKSIKELQQDEIDYLAAIEKTIEIEDVKNGLLTKYNSVSEIDRSKLTTLVPDQVDTVRLILNTNDLASRYGMALKNITITEQVSSRSETTGPVSGRFSPMVLSFNVFGDYDNFIAFLADLEESLRLGDVSSIVVAEDEARGLYSFRVSMKTYRLN